jgi:hypothetical protein
VAVLWLLVRVLVRVAGVGVLQQVHVEGQVGVEEDAVEEDAVVEEDAAVAVDAVAVDLRRSCQAA